MEIVFDSRLIAGHEDRGMRDGAAGRILDQAGKRCVLRKYWGVSILGRRVGKSGDGPEPPLHGRRACTVETLNRPEMRTESWMRDILISPALGHLWSSFSGRKPFILRPLTRRPKIDTPSDWIETQPNPMVIL